MLANGVEVLNQLFSRILLRKTSVRYPPWILDVMDPLEDIIITPEQIAIIITPEQIAKKLQKLKAVPDDFHPRIYRNRIYRINFIDNN